MQDTQHVQFINFKGIKMRLILLFISCCLPVAIFASSTNSTQVGRYITIANKPSDAQVNLMQQTLQVHFPTSVETVGDAIGYLLSNSGYSLVKQEKRNTALNQLMAKPLPVVDRDLNYMTLKEALLTLVEPAFYLQVDPLHRLVSFDIKASYRKYYKSTQTGGVA